MKSGTVSAEDLTKIKEMIEVQTERLAEAEKAEAIKKYVENLIEELTSFDGDSGELVTLLWETLDSAVEQFASEEVKEQLITDFRKTYMPKSIPAKMNVNKLREGSLAHYVLGVIATEKTKDEITEACKTQFPDRKPENVAFSVSEVLRKMIHSEIATVNEQGAYVKK